MLDSAREARRELAVDLDDVEALEACEQQPRERAQSRADLDHPVGGRGRDRFDQAP